MSFPYFKPNGKLLFNTDGTLPTNENCCCTLYCDDCCTGDLTGYEITISGVTNDLEGCDCEDLNDTFCILEDPTNPGCQGFGSSAICGVAISWRIESGPDAKCTLAVLVNDSASGVPSGHAAEGKLEFDAGDPCRDVSGAMTMTITPPADLFGEPIPTQCDLDGTQITVNGVCSE